MTFLGVDHKSWYRPIFAIFSTFPRHNPLFLQKFSFHPYKILMTFLSLTTKRALFQLFSTFHPISLIHHCKNSLSSLLHFPLFSLTRYISPYFGRQIYVFSPEVTTSTAQITFFICKFDFTVSKIVISYKLIFTKGHVNSLDISK